ncbi:hypothetical protein T440DRAFT_201086 [Plenodomus tracheiphilus IPT5]|uniref:Uncharacterized protein n=1 Tax=Plenodomus tracheiphilus IPT5 TaxID=1408161 RepID=A0A6A7BLH4_9PLEO|nr:hypothetical protein T440DRAFT_201086 [Plenodomus tracheiphilus IPT5]
MHPSPLVFPSPSASVSQWATPPCTTTTHVRCWRASLLLQYRSANVAPPCSSLAHHVSRVVQPANARGMPVSIRHARLGYPMSRLMSSNALQGSQSTKQMAQSAFCSSKIIITPRGSPHAFPHGAGLSRSSAFLRHPSNIGLLFSSSYEAS